MQKGTDLQDYTPEVRKIVLDWRRCKLCRLGHHAYRHVFLETIPEGSPVVDILMVGEGPGKAENALGRPFIGASGELLRKTIEKADPTGLVIGLDNLISCRPCEGHGQPNRPPSPDEIDECKPRLMATVEAVQPLMVLCLGNVPATNMPRILGEAGWNGMIWHVKHPSAVVRHGGARASYYQDYVHEFKAAFDMVRKIWNVRHPANFNHETGSKC